MINKCERFFYARHCLNVVHFKKQAAKTKIESFSVVFIKIFRIILKGILNFFLHWSLYNPEEGESVGIHIQLLKKGAFYNNFLCN